MNLEFCNDHMLVYQSFIWLASHQENFTTLNFIWLLSHQENLTLNFII